MAVATEYLHDFCLREGPDTPDLDSKLTRIWGVARNKGNSATRDAPVEVTINTAETEQYIIHWIEDPALSLSYEVRKKRGHASFYSCGVSVSGFRLSKTISYVEKSFDDRNIPLSTINKLEPFQINNAGGARNRSVRSILIPERALELMYLEGYVNDIYFGDEISVSSTYHVRILD